MDPDRIAAFLDALPERLRAAVSRCEPMSRHTSLRVGGPADLYVRATVSEDFAAIVALAQQTNFPHFVLGGGTNICVSDLGIRALVICNACEELELGPTTRVDTGYPMMRLSQQAAGAALSGLEFAIGLPGTLGGALVSNAGAYRHSIGEVVASVDVVEHGERKSVGAEWMEFAYRDSRLRRGDRAPAAVIRATLRLEPRPRREILARARENQAQRIHRQPWHPSAGSFFKNVYDRALAESLPTLPAPMKEAGVVPAGYLSSACGCKGLRVGGAQISRRHGNFVVNRGGATAADIRALTAEVKRRVRERFGVELVEEVLFVGQWLEEEEVGR
jgi:UDP-N-acetylmuramate dehydrogenase